MRVIAAACGTHSTLHVEQRRIRVVTLPTSIRATNPWPWLPVAIMSAFTLVANAEKLGRRITLKHDALHDHAQSERAVARASSRSASPTSSLYVEPHPFHS